MQHLLQALEKIAQSHSHEYNHDADILKTAEMLAQYFHTGDPRLLARLPAKQQPWRFSALAEALPNPGQWSVADRRALDWFIRVNAQLQHKKPAVDDNGVLLVSAIDMMLQREGPEDDFYAGFRAEFARHEIEEARVVQFTAEEVEPLAIEGRLTSAGRWLLSFPPALLAKEMPRLRENHSIEAFWLAWVANQIESAEATARALLRAGEPDLLLPNEGYHSPHASPWEQLLEADPDRNEQLCAEAFAKLQGPMAKFRLGERLVHHWPGKYEDQAWQAAKEAFVDRDTYGGPETIARWMLTQRGAEAVPRLAEYVAGDDGQSPGAHHRQLDVLRAATQALGAAARPVVLAGLAKEEPTVRHHAIRELMRFKDVADDDHIEQLLAKELASSQMNDVLAGLEMGEAWRLERIIPHIWGVLPHKSKGAREAAIAVLAKQGEAAVPQAVELLGAKKADTRLAAVTLLAKIGSTAGLEALRATQGKEKSDAVLDAIRAALPSEGSAEVSPAAPTRAAVEAVIRQAAAKAKLPAEWADPTKLPPLQFTDGAPLDADAVRYLLFRQARAKNIEPELEAKPLYALLDRATSGEFALAVLNHFFGSGAEAGDRWALAIVGLLGDERVVPLLMRQIEDWADHSRGKLAEYAVQALALQASDAALLAVDALSIRYRTKVKNIGKAAAEAFAKAAEARGLSPAELGDRVVPWLGFTPGEPRLLAWGETKLELTIGLDFKPTFRDLVKNKRAGPLPGNAPAESKPR